MANGGTITDLGRNALLNRVYQVTPTVSAFTQFVIGTGTGTPTNADTYSTFTGVPAGYPKLVQSGYPTFDTTNKQVTNRGYVLSTEANGITISETGEVNTDGTKQVMSRDVFTGIAKTNAIEIAIIFVHQVS